ncbi:energy transducer TonB, partial [Pseudomonas sp. FSL R10-0765]|nr:energy transducer TonB [Pseudomonas sp. FSL R10-0765]
MSAALMSAGHVEARPLPWTRLWHNSQAVAVTVALHSAVIAFLVLGW